MKKYAIWAGLFALIIGSAHGEGWYRWVDQAGGVHYGDTPPADAVEVEKSKFGAPVAADNVDLPYETRRAQQNFPVRFYVTGNCGDICVKARDYLTIRGIPFDEKVLRTKEEYDALRKESGSNGMPVIAVGKVWLEGFQAEQWAGELDAAGYPKSAPYRVPAPPQPQANKTKEKNNNEASYQEIP